MPAVIEFANLPQPQIVGQLRTALGQLQGHRFAPGQRDAVRGELFTPPILFGKLVIGQNGNPLLPSPGTTVSVSPVGSALPGFDPAPAVCPIPPALGNAVVPAIGSAPAPSNPAAGTGSRCRKSPWAVGTTELYSAAVLPPTGLAAPAALHLVLRRRWLETRSAPTPVLPLPPPLVPAYASRRFPSPPRCRSGCARSCWLSRL